MKCEILVRVLRGRNRGGEEGERYANDWSCRDDVVFYTQYVRCASLFSASPESQALRTCPLKPRELPSRLSRHHPRTCTIPFNSDLKAELNCSKAIKWIESKQYRDELESVSCPEPGRDRTQHSSPPRENRTMKSTTAQ